VSRLPLLAAITCPSVVNSHNLFSMQLEVLFIY